MIGGVSPLSTGVSYAVLAADQGKLIRATATPLTITFPDATSVGSPFVFALLNSSSGNITIAGPLVSSVQQLINGSASLTMAAGDGYIAFTDGTNWFVVGRKTGVLPPGHIFGCTLANGADATNDITITAGKVRDSTDTVDITVAAMATGKQLDANWAPGDAAGMRNSAAGITNTTYHLYVVAKADGTQDIYAHTSTTVATVITALQAETGGASYIYARRIGSITRVSSTIIAFTQRGDDFEISTPVADTVTTPGTSANTKALSNIPTGISVQAKLTVYQNAVGDLIYISALTQSDQAPSSGTTPLATSGGVGSTVIGNKTVWTNTSAQVRVRSNDGTTTIVIIVNSYVDARGKDS